MLLVQLQEEESELEELQLSLQSVRPVGPLLEQCKTHDQGQLLLSILSLLLFGPCFIVVLCCFFLLFFINYNNNIKKRREEEEEEGERRDYFNC